MAKSISEKWKALRNSTTVTLPSGSVKSAGNRPKDSAKSPLTEIADRHRKTAVYGVIHSGGIHNYLLSASVIFIS